MKLLEGLGLRNIRKPTTSCATARSRSAPRRFERNPRVLLVLFRTEEAVWKSFRNLGDRVQILLPEELNTYDVLVNDWLVFSKASLDATVARLADGGARRRRGRRRRRSCGGIVKDPRDIIIKPVVSEKSYAAYDGNVYTFVVAPDANKIEIRNAVEELFATQGRVGAHHQPQGQAQAQPHARVRGRHARDAQAGHRHSRRRRESIDIFGS